jgi:predicted transcriptional regulator of viral defense system
VRGENFECVVPYPRMPGEGNRGSPVSGRARRLSEVAGAQRGVVSLEQLREIGLTQRAAEYRAAEGTLHRVHRAVYAVGHIAIGRKGALQAAVLACGEGAVVSHGTAAALGGFAITGRDSST